MIYRLPCAPLQRFFGLREDADKGITTFPELKIRTRNGARTDEGRSKYDLATDEMLICKFIKIQKGLTIK